MQYATYLWVANIVFNIAANNLEKLKQYKIYGNTIFRRLTIKTTS